MSAKVRNFCGRTRREFLWEAGCGFGAAALTLAVQGANLGLWTSYRGKDPDVNVNPTGNQVTDGGQLPVPRTWQVRLSASY